MKLNFSRSAVLMTIAMVSIFATSCKKEQGNGLPKEPTYASFLAPTLDVYIANRNEGMLFVPITYTGTKDIANTVVAQVNVIEAQSTAIFNKHYVFNNDEVAPFNVHWVDLSNDFRESQFTLSMIIDTTAFTKMETLTIVIPTMKKWVTQAGLDNQDQVIDTLAIRFIPGSDPNMAPAK